MAVPIIIDFETRSLVDLTKTTADRYAEDPSTEVLCLALKAGDEMVGWWAPEWVAERVDLPNYITKGAIGAAIHAFPTVEAHNAGFEMALWHHIMVKRHGFSEIPLKKWRCSAAKAAMHGLPRSLAGAADALNLDTKKDMDGHKLMMKITR